MRGTRWESRPSGKLRLMDDGNREDAAAALPRLEEAVALAEQHPPEHADLEKIRATLAECRARLEP